ncbi:receptor-like protein kinase 1 [Actinidia rufa]|uniref:Receptor-like serine/threonine-protein kinase n=1 Tax=Actinidia rufa TaxID=165716 RepID=A0A7J0FPL5_9ERIC|nr:receptor-like protein kinase 1 [Actinidia rufa]
MALLKLHSLILLFPLFSSVFATSQSDCNVALGSSLSTQNENDHWSSPSGEFAFGFRHLEPPNDEDFFLLAIWFDKIPDKTIVWSANGAPARRGSSVTLTAGGELKLLNPFGVEIWKAENTNGTASSCAAMLDTGNFVLLNGDYDSVWESFKFPTDTILPSQTLAMKSKLCSRQSKTNYTNGRFQLRMQYDSNLVLYIVSMPSETILGPYWATGTWALNSISELVYDEFGSLYVTRQGAIVANLTTKNMGSSKDFYHLARVDSDGVFRQYNHPRRSGNNTDGSCLLFWSVVEGFPDDICTAIKGNLISGACGYNSYCEETNGMPSCLCPDGYSYMDPLDIQKGCKPNFQLPSCQNYGLETAMLFDFKEINNTDWPISDYDLQSGPEVDKEMCIKYCLYDCFCAAAVYYGNSCAKKKFPLSNGRKISGFNGTTLLKIPRGNVTYELDKKDRSPVILAIILASSLFLNFVLLLAIPLAVFFIYRKKLMNMQAGTFAMSVRNYAYKELEEATGGFKEKLGRGAFGTVYKGVLPSDPRRFVAVKNLDKVLQEGEKEFKTEVSVIGQTHHKNLVRLLGYCDEGDHRLLVYEYMSNGSLARLLFGISRPDWNQRVQIAFGIARGIMYLHEECSTQIIHCDIKPQNILLDEYFTPKISDFGLAKLLLAEQTRTAFTGIRGTIGYFAPEWFRKASITVKVDVYSFGVMLLEIVCCMSSAEFARWDQEKALVDWAYDCYCKRKLENLVENDEEARSDMKRLERLVMVAIWCIQEDPSIRPSMRKITQMLEGVIEVSIPPCPSLFSTS